MNKTTQDTMFSSALNGGTDEWETPPELYKKLDSRLHFTLDPAATSANALAPEYYTKESDGLLRSWAGHRLFINPPYSQVRLWTAKALAEHQAHGITIVMLLPARTDTKFYHEHIKSYARVHFIKGRLKFQLNGKPILDKKGRPVGAPFPSMLALFAPDPFEGL